MSFDDLLDSIKKSIFVFDRKTSDVHCYLVKIDYKYFDLLPSFIDKLSLEEFDRSLGLINPKKRFEFVYSRVITRWVLETCLDSRIEIALDSKGRPYIPGSPICFNISHSNEWLLIAISQQDSIGVDIEEIKDIPEQEFIEQHFLDFYIRRSHLKLNDINSEKLVSFYARWTAMEAFYKALGEGIPTQKHSKIDAIRPEISLFQKNIDNAYFVSVLALYEGATFRFVIIDPEDA